MTLDTVYTFFFFVACVLQSCNVVNLLLIIRPDGKPSDWTMTVQFLVVLFGFPFFVFQ